MADRPVRARRRISAEPAVAEEFYRKLVDSVPQMIWAARPDGSVDFVNARLLEYTGCSAQELEGWGWRSVVHPDDWENCLARWTKAYKKGYPYEVEYRLRRRDGRYFWHLGAAMPQREGDRIVRWFGSCTEIENQKRAERLLNKARGALQTLVQSRAEARDAPSSGARTPSREIHERLRSIMTLWSDFYWETDAEHRFTVLENGGRLPPVSFGTKRLGMTRWEIPSVLPDAEGWRKHREVLEARLVFRDFEIARKTKDGKVYHYAIDGEPAFDGRGRFQGYRGVGREITARKLSEQKLRENGRNFLALLDSLPGIAWIKDSKLRYAWTSASYERTFGKPSEMLLGRDDFQVWPEALAEHFRANDEKVLRANGAVQDLVDMQLPDGTPVRWLAVKFPLPDETGALGVAGISFDITERISNDASDALDDGALARLSGRELQVLHLMVEGCTSAEIGARLALSPKSVDTYRSRLMAKLGIETLPALVKFALRHGLTGER